jgi:hypothetical protein
MIMGRAAAASAQPGGVRVGGRAQACQAGVPGGIADLA